MNPHCIFSATDIVVSNKTVDCFHENSTNGFLRIVVKLENISYCWQIHKSDEVFMQSARHFCPIENKFGYLRQVL